MATQFSINSRRIRDLADLPADVALLSTYLIADIAPGAAEGQNRYATYKVTLDDVTGRIATNFESYVLTSDKIVQTVDTKIRAISAEIKSEIKSDIVTNPDYKQEIVAAVTATVDDQSIATKLASIDTFTDGIAGKISADVSASLTGDIGFIANVGSNVAGNAELRNNVATLVGNNYSGSIAESISAGVANAISSAPAFTTVIGKEVSADVKTELLNDDVFKTDLSNALKIELSNAISAALLASPEFIDDVKTAIANAS